jgi:hypothetical protein
MEEYFICYFSHFSFSKNNYNDKHLIEKEFFKSFKFILKVVKENNLIKQFIFNLNEKKEVKFILEEKNEENVYFDENDKKWSIKYFSKEENQNFCHIELRNFGIFSSFYVIEKKIKLNQIENLNNFLKNKNLDYLFLNYFEEETETEIKTINKKIIFLCKRGNEFTNTENEDLFFIDFLVDDIINEKNEIKNNINNKIKNNINNKILDTIQNKNFKFTSFLLKDFEIYEKNEKGTIFNNLENNFIILDYRFYFEKKEKEIYENNELKKKNLMYKYYSVKSLKERYFQIIEEKEKEDDEENENIKNYDEENENIESDDIKYLKRNIILKIKNNNNKDFLGSIFKILEITDK